MLFGLVTAPILARSMDPSERGIVGSIIAFLSFLPILLDFGVAAELRRRLLLSDESLAIKVRLLGLATLPFAILTGWLMSVLYFSGQSAALQLIVVAGSAVTPMLVLSAIDQSVLLNREDYLGVLFTRLTQPTIYFVGVIILFLRDDLTPESAIWVVILGHFATGIVGASLTRLSFGFGGEIRNLLRAGALFWLFGLGEFANARVDQILSIAALSHAEAGYYMVASIIIALPSAFIGTSIGAHYYKRNANFSSTGIWVANAMKDGILLGIPVVFVVSLASPVLLPVVFGSQYAPAIPSLLTGLAGSLFMILFTIASQLAASKNKLVILALSVWAGVIVDISLLFFLGRFGAIGASLASSAGYLTSLTLVLGFLRIDFKALKVARIDIKNLYSNFLINNASMASNKPTMNFGFSDFAKTWKFSGKKFLKVTLFAIYSKLFKVFPLQRRKVFLESFAGSVNGDSISPIIQHLEGSDPRLIVVTSNFAKSNKRMEDKVTFVRHSSLAWVYHLSTAKVVIVNTNLPFLFTKKSGQTIIQTWHGTPLKKMGLDRAANNVVSRSNASIVKDSKNWDYLLVSSAFNEQALVRALGFENSVLRFGLPRNDLLFRAEGMRDKLRESLGIKKNDFFVLYAPTWRDESKQKKAQEAFNELVESLPEPGVVLGVRSHGWSSLTFEKEGNEGLIDLSSHPNISELYLAADVLLTDYSSALFDFALTGKPIAFLLADLDEYEASRGLYLDIRKIAPGPIFKSGKTLLKRLKSQDWTKYKGSVSDWADRYSTYETGEATQKTIEVIRKHMI